MELLIWGGFFVLFFGLINAYFVIADKYNIIDKPNERSSHTIVTLRGGGILFLISSLVYFFYSGFDSPYFVLSVFLGGLISFIDDIKTLGTKIRLIVQLVSVLLLIYQLDIYTYGFVYVPIAIFVFLGIVNAFNFMDGINGITGLTNLVVVASVYYWQMLHEEIVSFDLLRLVMISIVVFGFYNFRKKAKCFAGDVGSVSLAIIVIYIISALILKTNNWGFLLFLSVFGVDGSLTILQRMMNKEKLTEPHRKHLYQYLANEVKIPHILVSSIFALVQLVVCISFIGLGLELLTSAIVLLLLVLVYILVKYFVYNRYLRQ